MLYYFGQLKLSHHSTTINSLLISGTSLDLYNTATLVRG